MATRLRSSISAQQLASVFKALGEPRRLRIVNYLKKLDDEATGSEVARHAGISLALLCHHTDALVEAGIVLKRKEGQTCYFRLDQKVLKAVSKAIGY
jgi:DNA-binding transcriptional ArsR family regulator